MGVVCLHKENEGLGVLDLNLMNIALLNGYGIFVFLHIRAYGKYSYMLSIMDVLLVMYHSFGSILTN
jgi:hypothetical protein